MDLVRAQAGRGGVAADRRDRQLAVTRGLALRRARLEQVDDDEPGAALHLAEERERIVDVLDHVEGVGGVEAAGTSRSRSQIGASSPRRASRQRR